jgi:hypothetical protein
MTKAFLLLLVAILGKSQSQEGGLDPDLIVLSNGDNAEAVDESNPFSIATDTTMNDKCNNIGQGNVPFFLVNAQEPDEIIFLALEKLPGNMELYLTDQPWNGLSLEDDLPNEGTVFMTTPKQGVEEGELFGYGPQATYGNRWIKERGTFSLGIDGDNIFLYCKDSYNNIRFLSGFSNFGGWSPELEPMYATNSSALPDSLRNSTITLPHLDNFHYNGPRDTRVSLLKQDIRNASEWVGTDDTRYEMGAIPERIVNSASACQVICHTGFSVGLMTLVNGLILSWLVSW